MVWMVFGLGIVVGTVAGVVIVALCQMGSGPRLRRRKAPVTVGCRYEPMFSESRPATSLDYRFWSQRLRGGGDDDLS